MNCVKWNKLRAFILCILDLPSKSFETFFNSDKVNKIIRSLLKEWRSKRTAIEEVKDLNYLSIDDLISLCISYEKDLITEKSDEDKKKKSITFKASKLESDNESKLKDKKI